MTIQQRIEAALGTSDTAQINRTLKKLGFWIECGRCQGKGHLNAFAHIHGGTCFACNKAKGRIPRMTKTLVAELEAKVAAGALVANKAESGKAARVAAMLTHDMTTKWLPSRVGRQMLFAVCA